jgi:hypothetical protein
MSGTSANQSFANALLNDRANPQWDGSSWAGIVMSIVGTFGVAPSMAAGIRYLPRDAQTTHTFYHPWTGNTTYDPGHLGLPSPTAAHWRLAPVALTRVGMNVIEPYKECTLVFDKSPCLGGNPGANASAMNNLNNDATACQTASNDWQACFDQCEADVLSGSLVLPFGMDCQDVCDSRRPPNSCADLGSDLASSLNSPPGCPGPGCARP